MQTALHAFTRPVSSNRRRRPSARSLEIFRRNYILGQTVREIAADSGVCFQRVAAICKGVREWLNQTPTEPNIPALRQYHDQVFGWLIKEALVEWEKSKKSFKTTKARMVRGRVDRAGKPLPDLVTSEQVEQERQGDPRYPQVVDQLMKSQRAMWGADEPKRTEISGPEGAPLTIATLLKVVADNPPPVPVIEAIPENVMDVDSVLLQLESVPDEHDGQSLQDGEFSDEE